MGNALAYAFYGIMGLAFVYFVHKVAWFVRLRKIQAELIHDALRRLKLSTGESLRRWDQSVQGHWLEIKSELEDRQPTDYLARVTKQLRHLQLQLLRARIPIRDALARALDPATAPPETEDARQVVAEIPRLSGEMQTIEIDLHYPRLRPPRPPDVELYHLQLSSRYSFGQRLIVFLLGAADVVYSSQHVAMMSHNVQVPTGVIIRRLSLVVLILLVVALDVIFSARRKLVAFVEERFGSMLHVDWGNSAGDLVNEHAASGIALAGWLAAYGLLYVGIYLFLRRRSSKALRSLRRMQMTESERLNAIHEGRVAELLGWSSEYARTLDDAAEVALRQASMLTHRTLHRMRRRIATPNLLRWANEIANTLFHKLPEASQDLRDVTSTQKHSLGHYLWPRRGEMTYQVSLAQFRAAWQNIEAASGRLRGADPDPAATQELWRSLIGYASMFPDVVPPIMVDDLERAYRDMMLHLVRDTEDDLLDLDAQLVELARGLAETVGATAALVETRVDLANQSIEADVANHVAEIIKLREQARVEAMAFEI